jgi:hypothetical protein
MYDEELRVCRPGDDPFAFEHALRQLETAGLSFGARFINDAATRAGYRRGIVEFVWELRDQVRSGAMSMEEATRLAHQTRNLLMEQARARTSDFGRAMAQEMKASGRTFEQLLDRYAREIYGRPPAQLTQAERDRVMRRILVRASRSNASVNALVGRLGVAGRALVAVSIGLAVYNVATAEDPARAAVREGAVVGSGVLGGMAGGAAAGLVCGPGAPVCSGIGIIVGGVLFALGADLAWQRWMED